VTEMLSGIPALQPVDAYLFDEAKHSVRYEPCEIGNCPSHDLWLKRAACLRKDAAHSQVRRWLLNYTALSIDEDT